MRFFVNPNALNKAALPFSDAEIAGDEITTLRVNYEWRKIIVSALEAYYWQGKSDPIGLDNEDKLSDFLIDLYTFEASTMALKTTVIQDDLGTNRSTSSTSFVSVTNSQVLFTPTHSKMRVRVQAFGRHPTMDSSLFIRAMADGVVGNEANEARLKTTANTPITVSDIWDVIPDVEIELELQFRTDGGTGTLDDAALLVWEIIEYD